MKTGRYDGAKVVHLGVTQKAWHRWLLYFMGAQHMKAGGETEKPVLGVR